MWSLIATPFGWIMKLCYTLVKNYGIALLLFSVIIKLIMLPSGLKQQKDSARMAKLQPKLEQIRKKYANNKEKLNEATMELYNQEGANPMGSCLPMIVTYVILFAIIEVVYAPMTYISGLPKAKIDEAVHTVVDVYNMSQAVYKDIPEAEDAEDAENSANKVLAPTLSERLAGDTNIEELFAGYNEDFKDNVKLSEDRLAEIVEVFNANPGIDEYFNDAKKVSTKLLRGGYSNRTELIVLSIAKDYPQLFSTEISEFCQGFDYTFLGLYLGRYPSWSEITIIIPIISLLSQILVMFASTYYMKRNGQKQQGMGILYAMPILSFMIAFSFPAGIGIYWIFSAVLGLIETVLKNLYYTPERMDKIIARDAKKKARKPSLYQLALEQQKAQNGGRSSLLDDLDEVKLTKSERKEVERQRINEARKKLASDDDSDTDPRVIAARRRMEEKYGEE